MINWRYLAPRAVIVFAVAIAVWLGLDPLLRLTLRTLGSRLLGAKVEIAGSRTSLVGTNVRLTGVQIADPNSPHKNLVEAREAELQLEPDSLLAKKIVVREARLSGLKFSGRRETSGALEKVSGHDFDLDVDQHKLADLAGVWLRTSADVLKQGLEQDLESVRLAKEILQRWPTEYERLAGRADDLARRIKELKMILDNPDPNPVKNLESYRQAAAEMDAIHDELRTLRESLKQLPRQARLDKDALIAAERRDVARLRQQLWLNNLDAETFTQYLLGPEQGRQVEQVIGWIHWARRLVPSEATSADPLRGRGQTIVFPGAKQTPDFLVRALRIDGELQLGSELAPFEAEATGLSTQPKLHDRPAVLSLKTAGSTPLVVQASFDRRAAVPHDWLEVSCPKIVMPRRVLGRPDQLAVAVSPGAMQLHARLDLRGDELSGRITVTQDPVELKPALAASFGGERVARGLAHALATVRRVDAAIDLSGTLEQPSCKLSSNLGPQLTAGIQGIFQQELDTVRAELAQQVEQHLDSQLARLDRLLAAKEQELASKLNLGEEDLALLSRHVASRTGLPDKLLSPKLPGVNLFKQ